MKWDVKGKGLPGGISKAELKAPLKPRAGRILVPCALGVPAAPQHKILAERGRRKGGKMTQTALDRD